MSLQIAIQQIQKPSFYGQQTPNQKDHSHYRDRFIDSNARREEILRILRITGKPMDYETLSAQTKLTWQSLRNLINTLVTDGKVMRSKAKNKNGTAMVEAI